MYLLLGTSKLLHASLVLLTLKEKMSVSTQVISAYTFVTQLSIIHSLNFSYIKPFAAWTDAHRLPELHMLQQADLKKAFVAWTYAQRCT